MECLIEPPHSNQITQLLTKKSVNANLFLFETHPEIEEKYFLPGLK